MTQAMKSKPPIAFKSYNEVHRFLLSVGYTEELLGELTLGEEVNLASTAHLMKRVEELEEQAQALGDPSKLTEMFTSMLGGSIGM